MDMNSFGKMLVIFGAIVVLVGAIMMLGGRFSWFGRLPGDIYIQKKNLTFFFPITTSIIVSVILSMILILLRRK